MRPYCEYCDDGCVAYAHRVGDICDGCRLEAACNAMGIALALAGAMAQLVETWRGVAVSERYARGVIAERAGIVLP